MTEMVTFELKLLFCFYLAKLHLQIRKVHKFSFVFFV